MAKQGYKWDLKVASEAVPATFKTLGKAQDVDLTADSDMLDTSTRDGAGWKGQEQGLRNWKASATHLWVPSDDAYILLQAAYLAGTKLLCQFSETTPATGVKGFDGNAVVKSIGIPQKINGAVVCPIEFEGDGALAPVTRA